MSEPFITRKTEQLFMFLKDALAAVRDADEKK